jgi:hypothetical protein
MRWHEERDLAYLKRAEGQYQKVVSKMLGRARDRKRRRYLRK